MDSIVAINQDLAILKVVGRSHDYEGHDSLVIQRSIGQIVKIRHCAITIKNPSPTWNADAELGYNYRIHDLRVGTGTFNFFDAIQYKLSREKSINGYNDNQYFTSRTTTFNEFPNVFIDTDEKIYIDYMQDFDQGTRTVNYRFELVYYSHE